ncbi:hypothetical protein PUN28_002968 [Cardiocondyla obscurior]|uniref:Uncharacterized protein n=1 Tax=Cardiocondyla obscurior TaxID=286306 RepID=A0AAW2GX50_9HYME
MKLEMFRAVRYDFEWIFTIDTDIDTPSTDRTPVVSAEAKGTREEMRLVNNGRKGFQEGILLQVGIDIGRKEPRRYPYPAYRYISVASVLVRTQPWFSMPAAVLSKPSKAS